jgi:hypothetical protein
MDSLKFSRRDFLKLLAGVGVASALPAARSGVAAPQLAGQAQAYGRCLMVYVTVYSRPSVYGAHRGIHPQDSIIPLFEPVLTVDDYARNPNWYRTLNGYVHASNVQIVRWDYQPAHTYTFPAQGNLVEITIPYSNAFQSPDPKSRVLYRLYYSSVFWAIKHVRNAAGSWYLLQDDRSPSEQYYVASQAARVLLDSELTALSPQVRDKRITIELGTQTLRAYEGTKLVLETLISSGANYKQPDGSVAEFGTPLGNNPIYRKLPTRHMAGGDAAAPDGYDLPGVPWVSFFNGGMAIHGTYWHNDYGTPWSHGCINTPSEVAKWIYRWATPSAAPDQAEVLGNGTTVEVS